MRNASGSAIVVAMFLLVLLSALGMYAVTLPLTGGDVAQQQYRSAVAVNLARAGAHAAMASLPRVFPDDAPYVRRMNVGPVSTASYSVASRAIGRWTESAGSGRESVYEDFLLVSEGSVPGEPGARFQVKAEVRFRISGKDVPRVLVRKWEEKGL